MNIYELANLTVISEICIPLILMTTLWFGVVIPIFQMKKVKAQRDAVACLLWTGLENRSIQLQSSLIYHTCCYHTITCINYTQYPSVLS